MDDQNKIYFILFYVWQASILQENPVDRLSRMIKEMFWDNLTRSVDENGTTY